MMGLRDLLAQPFHFLRVHFPRAGRPDVELRHCEERSDEAIHLSLSRKNCFAEPVIGRAFARPVGSQ